jgi:uncharacterized protein
MRQAPEPRFMMDHMVERAGKYLRIIGYDAVWDPGVRSHELIVLANRDGRVFVTRNRRIPDEYPKPDRLFTVDSPDPVAQFQALVSAFALDTQTGLFAKCIRCNEYLVEVPDKREVRGLVHPHVYEERDRFFRCPACGTVFWFGSHVRNTCRKLGLPAPSS